METVVISIQARMNSVRFPGKVLKKVGDKTILEWILRSCLISQGFLRRQPGYNIRAIVCLAVPRNDMPIIELFNDKVEIVEGPENDVLTRHIKALNKYEADYLVRVTGDCLAIPPFMISKHVKNAIRNKLDYCTNVLERTSPEGWDTEVISRKMLDWLDTNCTEGSDREHVTSLIKKYVDSGNTLSQFRMFNSIESTDMSHFKTSIDTEEEYHLAVKGYRERMAKLQRAKVFEAEVL